MDRHFDNLDDFPVFKDPKTIIINFKYKPLVKLTLQTLSINSAQNSILPNYSYILLLQNFGQNNLSTNQKSLYHSRRRP